MVSRRSRLASLVATRDTIWNSPSGPRPVKIKRIHSKSARIVLDNGEDLVVPVSELDLSSRWKAKYKHED